MSVNIKGETNEGHNSELQDANKDGHNFTNDNIPESQNPTNQQAHDDQVDINMDEIDKVISESINHGNEQAGYQQSYIDNNDSSKRHLDETGSSTIDDYNKRQRVDEYGTNSNEQGYTSIVSEEGEKQASSSRGESERNDSTENPQQSSNGTGISTAQSQDKESQNVTRDGHNNERESFGENDRDFQINGDNKVNQDQSEQQEQQILGQTTEQDKNKQNNELELEFEKAIEDHHQQMSKSPEPSNLREGVINEKRDLQMIASELEKATESNKDTSKEKESNEGEQTKVYHGGLNVPANSELLNTNTAYAAYNALSSQLPPLSILANAHLAALPLPIVAADYLPPRIQLLINTLPTLDNLASQLLRIVALGPYQKILDLAAHPDTPAGATFRDLTSLFEFTKRLYSEEDPFLSVEHLAPGMWKEGDKTPSIFRNREQLIELTLRKVNLATFLGATLGTIEVGFFYLNESFLDIFCPANNLDPANTLSNMSPHNMSLQSGVNTIIGDKIGKLLKPQTVLYLDLKTQAYISAIEAGGRSREDILEDILPHNLEDILLERRKTKILTPTEFDFIDRCKSRKEILLNYPSDKVLSDEYDWLSFLKELFEYSAKNMGFLIWGKKGRATKERNPINKEAETSNTPHSDEVVASASTNDATSMSSTGNPATYDLRSQEISDITKALLPSEIQEQQIHLRLNPGSNVKSLQRRPWTREEEKALRHALELKGPLWSNILELFGAGGKISEALKNRSQVQLKDKARNWKMFFLKSGLPVPAYLQKVTGDLERDDRLRQNKRLNRNRKTAAAPVPTPIQNQKSPGQ